mgnify:CR=1 FL=1
MADLRGEKDGEVSFIPDRLIADPVVFRGMSDVEILSVSGLSLIVWTPLSIAVLSVFDKGIFGLAVGAALTLATVWIVGGRLQRMKQKYPDGLHLIHIKKWLQNKGLMSFGYTTHSQVWDTRRSHRVERVSMSEDS